MCERWVRFATKVAGAGAFLIIWHLMAVTLIPQLPTPGQSLASFWSLLWHPEPILGRTLLQHAVASLVRVLLGTVLAALVAIPLGLLRGRSAALDDLASPATEILRPVPPIAWIPLGSIVFLALTGAVDGVKIFIVFIGAFFPMLINALYGAKSIDPVFIDVARSFRASRWQVWRTIVVPASLPSVITGVRIGLGVAWMSIVAAEMIGGSASGLGFFILSMYTVGGDTAAIVAGMGAIGIIGFAMNELLLLANRRALRWL